MIMVITVALVLALVLVADVLELLVARRSLPPRRRPLVGVGARPTT